MNVRDFLSQSIASIASVLFAFFIGAVIIRLIGRDPAVAIFSMFSVSLGDYFGIGSTLNLAAVLLLTGLAALVSFKAGIWNLGMEGQLYIGGLVGTAIALTLPSYGGLILILAYLAGIVAGGLYSALAGLLKARLKVNEIVSTIMLNYIALLLVDLVAGGPLHEKGSAINVTPPIPSGLRMPQFPGSTIQPTILLAILVAVGLAFLVKKTKLGFEIRMMAGNDRAAKYVGLNMASKTVLVMFISGALAGFAGCFLVFGISYSVFDGISKSYGYLGIGVALLASLNSIASVISAFLFSILNVGAVGMQASIPPLISP